MPGGVQIPFSAEDLSARARRITGIDIDDRDALEPLRIMLRSLNEESELHAAGAQALEERFVRILSNRLRMRRDFERHPEIAEQKIEAPVFLFGMARTGSTKTQKLFAASGDFNWLPYWKTVYPALLSGSRSESPQPRIDATEEFARWFDAASPDVRYAHPFETHEPEEDSAILEHSLRTPVCLGWSPYKSYLTWLVTQDMTAQFVYLRDSLKYLQWQGLAEPGRRWFLKSPLYTGLEAEVLKVFPDACLVMTHRHPSVTTPSGLRLLELFYKPYTRSRVDVDFYLAGQAAAAEAHLANRARMPELKLLDVDFRELVKSEDSVIQRIYEFCGIPLTDASRARMLKWSKENPQHKRGRHIYSLADFGLTEERIAAAFPGYAAFLRKTFGP